MFFSMVKYVYAKNFNYIHVRTLKARSGVTVGNMTCDKVVFFTHNDSYNNILKFGHDSRNTAYVTNIIRSTACSALPASAV
jgi:hypothetical protein